MYNRLIAVGNVGKGGGELRYTPQGTPVCNFSLATTTGWGDAKATMWIRCTMWGKLAESLSQYIVQGKQVLIEGEFQIDAATGGPRTWTSAEGITKASFEVTVREIRLLGSKSEVRSDEDEVQEGGEIPF